MKPWIKRVRGELGDRLEIGAVGEDLHLQLARLGALRNQCRVCSMIHVACLLDIADHRIRRAGQRLFIASVNEHHRRTRGPAGLNVSPPVADREAARQIQIETVGRLEQHPGLRLAAIAFVRIVVRADEDSVQIELGSQRALHPLELARIEVAARDLRLIGDADEPETGLAKALQRPPRLGVDPHLGRPQRRSRHAADLGRLGQHSVAVEEHRRRGHVQAPASRSASISVIERRSASREPAVGDQPRARIRSVDSRTTGTSPFQPRLVGP